MPPDVPVAAHTQKNEAQGNAKKNKSTRPL